MGRSNVFPIELTLTPTASKDMHQNIIDMLAEKYDLEPVEIEDNAKRVIRFYEKE